ncbi:hypothetical protein P4679_25250 [Priestia megaterium]|uniref:hypothetical protein n=1 Tax=Priestia megaterium TaxID=1404 RepID=UPI002E24EADA|nr:hypothetical protein [Priestia megaterium]
MKKTGVLILGCFLVCSSLLGCSKTSESDVNTKEVKWYSSEEKAFNEAKKERSDIQDIIGESKYYENEKVVIYTINDKSNVGVGTATITQKNNKVSWEVNNNPAIIQQPKGNTDVSYEFKTTSGKKYELYAGTPTGSNMKIETKTDTEITPHIDKEHNIFYYLSPIPSD